jgi:hypothetical protein
MLATPAYAGTTHLPYTAALAATVADFHQIGLSYSVNLAGCFSQIHAARNYMAAQFLAEPALTHLMFIDADISWPRGSIQRLLQHGQPMVCGLYPNKTPECDFAFYPVPGSEVHASPEQGIRIEIELALTGFLLISREVFTRIIAARPDLKLTSMGQGGEPHPKLAPWLYDFSRLSARTGSCGARTSVFPVCGVLSVARSGAILRSS